MADPYIGEFFDESANAVFSIFHVTLESGLYIVTGYDGSDTTVVCTFHPGGEPEWSARWQDHDRRTAIAERATGIARREQVPL